MDVKDRLEVLSTSHARYQEFYDLLCGPEACNFRKEPKDPKDVKDPDDPEDAKHTVWTCHHDKRFTKAIIEKMGGFAVEASTAKIGGGLCCDCEIAFNRSPRE